MIVVMVSDTADKKLGRGCEATVKQWNDTLKNLVPSERYEFLPLGTKDDQNNVITADFVRSFFGDIRKNAKAKGGGGIGKNDTLVCLYHGHGGRGVLGDHYVQLSHNNEWMYSHELRDLVNAVPCKLKVIMSCSCNTGIWDRLFGDFAMDREIWDVDKKGIAPIMDSLFFGHTGLLHMNASWPGHYSYTNTRKTGPDGENLPPDGSWFFHSFLNYCDINASSRPSWVDIDKMLDKELNRRFKAAKQQGNIETLPGQNHANVVTWRWPKRD